MKVLQSEGDHDMVGLRTSFTNVVRIGNYLELIPRYPRETKFRLMYEIINDVNMVGVKNFIC